jgi:hypothetical protein
LSLFWRDFKTLLIAVIVVVVVDLDLAKNVSCTKTKKAASMHEVREQNQK